MTRLLFVLDIGFDRGGPSVHLLQDIIRSGLEMGNSVDVILKDTSGEGDIIPKEFLNNPLFSYKAIKENDEKKMGFVGRYISEVRYAKKCSRHFLNNGKYDAVFLQSNTVAYFYVKQLNKLKCKIVFNVQDIFPYNLMLSGQLPVSKISFPLFRKLQNIAYQSVDAIITISDDMRNTLINDGVASSKINVIYNWSYADTPIVLDQIDKNRIYDLHMDYNKINVVYAGNIGKMQNVELIAKAARHLKDNSKIHFYIIGDGVNKHNVEAIVDGIPNVTMIPMQSSRFAESIYAQADINLIPLAPGGIKTALPSKTATVLRVNRPVVFCVDKNSEIKQLLSNNDKVSFVDCRSSDELVDLLDSQTNKFVRNKSTFFNMPECISCSNSKKYIEILCS